MAENGHQANLKATARCAYAFLPQCVVDGFVAASMLCG